MELAAHVVKLNSQTSGRDKLCRLVQYTAKFLRWHWAEHGADKTLLQKCLNVENTFGSTRKVLRLGRSLDMLLSALSDLKRQPASLVKLCLIVTKISTAAYLLADHLVLATRLGLLDAKRSTNLNKMAARFWLVSILASLLRNVLDISRIIALERKKNDGRNSSVGMSRDVTIARGSVLSKITADRPVVIDTVKNVTDLFLPLATLGYVQTSDGFQGLMGMISSYMGLLAVWNPALKLSP